MHPHPHALLPVLLVVTAVLLGSRPESECDWETFSALQTVEAKAEALQRCPPERRVDLYLKDAYSTVPPSFDVLLEAIVASDAGLVPFVVQRIERAERPEDELGVPALFLVLARIQQRGYYSIGSNPDLMRRLEVAVGRMKNPELKEGAENGLRWLRQPQSQSQFPQLAGGDPVAEAQALRQAQEAGGQSFLQRLGFGMSEAEHNQINTQISNFERQIRGPIELFAEALEIKDAVAVPLFITGTGLALVGSGLAITGSAITGGSVATGPGAGLLAPAGLFITANGVAITTVGGSIAFDTINRTFGTSLPTIPQLRRGP